MMTIIEKIKRIKESIHDSNLSAHELHENQDFRFFESVSIPWERVEPSELGFIRVVSWLYVMYIDIKKNSKNIQFLSQQHLLLGYQNHIENVNRLRTYFQHQITPTGSIQDRDTETKEWCNNFFNDIIKKNYPESEDEWTDVLNALLEGSMDINDKINASLETLKKDSTNRRIDVWKKQLQNTHEKYEFEVVFRATIADIGLETLDAYTLTEQNLTKWRKQLEKLEDSYNFNYELRKIIEQDLIEQKIPPPVNGDDFINVGIEKGIRLKQALTLAREIYYQSPCNKEQLIKAVIEKL